MATVRIELTNDVLKKARAEAAAGDIALKDYSCSKVTGLVLRIRGGSISWLLRTKKNSIKLGSPPDMGVREAREAADKRRLAPEPAPATSVTVEQRRGWTWNQAAAAYIEHISDIRIVGGRERTPSEHTKIDAERAFNRAPFQVWKEMLVTELTPRHLSSAVREIRRDVSYRQAEKALAYVRSALSWTFNDKGEESGLDALDSLWWHSIKMPQPAGDEAREIAAKKRPTSNPEFGIAHVAQVLKIHEEFCHGRIGRDKISPGIRWGLWWDLLTVNRSGASTQLRIDDIRWSDDHVPDDWGLVRWPAEIMKGKRDFWLPIPPLGIHVLRNVTRDWTQAVQFGGTNGNRKTSWAFPSTRRIGRDLDNTDIVVTASGLSTHLANMRGKRQAGHRNHLEGIPRFSLHTVRGAASTHIMNRLGGTPGAASALLAHVLPGDNDPKIDAISPTTAAFYSHAQRIPLKLEAMRAWSEALLCEYSKIGGIYPS